MVEELASRERPLLLEPDKVATGLSVATPVTAKEALCVVVPPIRRS